MCIRDRDGLPAIGVSSVTRSVPPVSAAWFPAAILDAPAVFVIVIVLLPDVYKRQAITDSILFASTVTETAKTAAIKVGMNIDFITPPIIHPVYCLSLIHI